MIRKLQPEIKKILIYGYGNPGCQDDGLGIAFTEKMEVWINTQGIKNIDFDTNYQLNIEDAETISGYDYVIFADASIEDIPGYSFTRVEPSGSKIEFTMHAVSPAFILDLCQKIYGKSPETFLLHLKGCSWEFREGLTDEAVVHLEKAVVYIQSHIRKYRVFKEGRIKDK